MTRGLSTKLGIFLLSIFPLLWNRWPVQRTFPHFSLYGQWVFLVSDSGLDGKFI